MANMRGFLLVLLLIASLSPQAYAIEWGSCPSMTLSVFSHGLMCGKVVKGIRDVAEVTKHVVKEVVGKIPVIGGAVESARDVTHGVAGTALNVATHVADKVDDVIQDGIDAVAPDTPCYESLGCFPMTGPWRSLDRLVPTPQTPEEIDTKFYLYTRDQPERYFIQLKPNISMNESDYNGSRTTVFIAHGFASTGNTSWLEEMKDAVLNKMDANVIIVDWGNGACKLNYVQVTSNTRVVGAEIARLGLYLIKHHDMSPKRLHLIGHSLGAHIMSYVSRNISKIARITGLDPAQPLFENFPEEVLLDRSDAEFVDIIHTDAEPFFPFLGFGVIREYGDDDFYINGGKNQPGCSLTNLLKPNISSIAVLATTLVETIAEYVSCPHGRSYEVFTASLRDDCIFLGAREPDSDEDGRSEKTILDYIAPLGLSALQFPARGSFNVKTTGTEPFCDNNTVDKELLSAAARKLRNYNAQ